MTSLLSAISGKFNVSLVFGTALPATIFVIVARLLLPPMFPEASALPFVKDSEFFSLSLLILILTGLLHHLNTSHIRIYEGYPWANTVIGRWKTKKFERRMAVLTAQRAGLAKLSDRLEEDTPTWIAGNGDLSSVLAKSEFAETAALRVLQAEFPTRPSSLLPTRLGNTIRSFENYSQRTYGMSAIALYPRLAAVMDPQYAMAVESAKSSLDFMLNSATLSFGLGSLLLTSALLRPDDFLASDSWPIHLLEVVTLGMLSVWFYRLAIPRAGAWGNMVRGAFDLYRWDLLRKLGYSRLPRTAEEESRLWHDISLRIAYADDPRCSYSTLLEAPAARTFARSSTGAALSVHRGIEATDSPDRFAVVLKIRTPDSDPPCQTMMVQDTLPDGFEYLSATEAASRGTVEVEGSNPFQFHLLGETTSHDVRVVRYEIQRIRYYEKSTHGGEQ